MDSNRMYIYYTVAFELLKFRGYTVREQPATTRAFNESFSKNNFVKVMDADSRIAVIIVDDAGTPLRSNAIERFFRDQVTCHTIIVASKSAKANSVKNYIVKMEIAEKPVKHRVETAIYDNICFNMPTHVQFTHYELVSADEVARWKKEERRSVNQLSVVLDSDPCIIWHGYKIDDIVIEIQPSPNAGRAMQYKRVAQTPAKM